MITSNVLLPVSVELQKLDLEQRRDLLQHEFDYIYHNKKRATDMLIEVIFHLDRYPKISAYLDIVHELWILENNRAQIS